MKHMVGLIGVLGLAACASSGQLVQGVNQPNDAVGLMLTSASADQVAQCLGRMYNVSATPSADGFIVAGGATGTSYHVVSFADPLERYKTRIDVLGRIPASGEPIVSKCEYPETAFDS